MREILVGIAILLALLFPWYTWNEYLIFKISMVWIYAIVLLGLILLTGGSGRISLGHTAFLSIGAYCTAILVTDYHVHYLLTLPIAAVLGFVAGFLFGYPVRQLKFLYLVLATLGLGLALPQIIKRAAALTGGVQGKVLPVLSPPSVLSINWETYVYLLAFMIMLVGIALIYNFFRSSLGRATFAVRDNELAAAAMGINVGRIRVMTFAISAAYSSVAGALLVLATLFVAPDIFDFNLATLVFMALILGGVGRLEGAIVGGFFLQFVPQLTADIYRGAPSLILATILILSAYFMPKGIVEGVRDLKNKISDFIFKRNEGED